MKELEKRSLDFQNHNSDDFVLGLPIILRLDGNNFSKFTKGLDKPYDERLSKLMIETCKWAVNETNAVIGFVGSDEITLVLYTDDYYKTQLYYNRKKRKIYSILSAKMSAFFNRELPKYIPEKNDLASFDCRGWNVPNLEEVCNELLVREHSINKNAISMACMTKYSHKELLNKSGATKKKMLLEKGINFNEYPIHFKRGIYIQRRKVFRQYSNIELNNLPLKHHARMNPNLMVERNEVIELEIISFSQIKNKIDVVFNGLEPI